MQKKELFRLAFIPLAFIILLLGLLLLPGKQNTVGSTLHLLPLLTIIASGSALGGYVKGANVAVKLITSANPDESASGEETLARSRKYVVKTSVITGLFAGLLVPLLHSMEILKISAIEEALKTVPAQTSPYAYLVLLGISALAGYSGTSLFNLSEKLLLSKLETVQKAFSGATYLGRQRKQRNNARLEIAALPTSQDTREESSMEEKPWLTRERLRSEWRESGHTMLLKSDISRELSPVIKELEERGLVVERVIDGDPYVAPAVQGYHWLAED